jgi:hypothetical protein
MTSLVAVFGPLVATTLYALTSVDRPGFAWVCGAGFYLLCVPALIRLRTAVVKQTPFDPGGSPPQPRGGVGRPH